MKFIAHIRDSDGAIQSVEEHLLEVKALAESYGESIGVKHLAGLAGILHDMGKYTNSFRDYLLDAVNNPDSPPKRGSVDHSTAGGKLLFDLLHLDGPDPFKQLVAEIVGNVIISHHSYLQDFLSPDLESSYLKRVRDKEIKEYEEAKQAFFNNVMNHKDLMIYIENASIELQHYLKKKPTESLEMKVMFLTKFIFSSLIDADRTNTRLFEENQTSEQPCNDLLDHYYKMLLEKIQSFNDHADALSPINLLRKTMSEQCDLFAEKPSGIYTLSIPTGGGKTLASLRYALKHGKLYKKKRIIFVVPYTTIIEQNAEETRKVLKDDINILEHHSNVIEDEYDNDEDQDGKMSTQQKLKLAKDNWESPIIFTTMVQFLNVFFAKGSRNVRRLHNLSESVLIFDEVQKVPVSCVSLFNNALNFLKEYANCSVVLCTATQPALEFVEHKLSINKDAEIVENIEAVIESFKRVNITDIATNTSFNNENMACFIEEKIIVKKSILVILNTKAVVRELYTRLVNTNQEVRVFHLSTSMCAAHRNSLLAEIRECLKNGEKVICISTQLIEAGVDISFECVVRSLAGLDSIAQAAGRCNRHGENGIQDVYIIDHEQENLDKLKEIKIGKNISRKILLDLKGDINLHGGHLLSKEALYKYFTDFYDQFQEDLNYHIPKLGKDMTELLFASREKNTYYQSYPYQNDNKHLPLIMHNSYKTAADHFNVIEDKTTSVVVPYGEGKEIIADLNGASSIGQLTSLLKRAQQYSVNLYHNEKNELDRNGGLRYYLDGKVLVLTEGAYNEDFGVDVNNESGFEEAIF